MGPPLRLLVQRYDRAWREGVALVVAAVPRTPWPEFVIFGVGIVSALASALFDSDPWFIASVFTCIFAGLSMVVTRVIGMRGRTVQIAAIVAGGAAVAFGAVWMARHWNEPEIFSPAFVGYLGGGVLLSGILNLVFGSPRT
ncbi:hypothetical protein ERC79_17345 [Rhodococcus sp. ABRD24]|uniref:hypothetical protein n=1 Tax=Rhodococcus sp. ABRD24 TaxID=2507582 RepID=UPI00103D3F75|nr:hypothetical protein [Rhodococcus sp. ABRD24]QBJ97508.1 hypothetical protein ERC79_17345 [Rhodococcus sp. ABRD24]